MIVFRNFHQQVVTMYLQKLVMEGTMVLCFAMIFCGGGDELIAATAVTIGGIGISCVYPLWCDGTVMTRNFVILGMARCH